MSLADRLLEQGPIDRLVGRRAGSLPGTTLLVVAGIHGNEPAGVLAARRVLAKLERDATPLAGELAVFAGNVAALRRGVRYIDRDLNRGWSSERLDSLAAGCGASEDREQLELATAIRNVMGAARGPIIMLDLHTTSAPGAPFAMVRNDPSQREFALRFPLPIIMGLLELVDSTLLEHLRRQGCLTLGVEAGQNDDERSIEHHESLLWLALVEAGLLQADDVPELGSHRGRLVAARGDLPHLTEVEQRHAIAPEDAFRMHPGYTNIQRVRAGAPLAEDRHGPIHAPRDGVLLLPLYQAQGNDGFFLGREVAARVHAEVRA
jgi:predicted deacylase